MRFMWSTGRAMDARLSIPISMGHFREARRPMSRWSISSPRPRRREKPYAACAKLHTQWPGTGTIGDPAVDQVVAGQGGSFIADLEATHNVWRHNMSRLLDKIGPAIIMEPFHGRTQWMDRRATRGRIW